MSKICFITGANSGIGKAAAIELALRGCTVLVGSRNTARGTKALQEIRAKSNSEKVELIQIDLASRDSIKKASEQIITKYDRLDVLIHNAADFNISQKQVKLSPENIETLWATNHLGPVLLTNLLLEWIKKSKQGRILTVASEGLKMFPFLKIRWDDIEFKQRKFTVTKAYYQSKLAQVMYTYWLAEQLADTQITVNCIRVTNVKIDMSRYPEVSDFMKSIYKLKSRFSLSPKEMAKTYTYLALEKNIEKVTGKYFNEKNEQVSSNRWSKNRKNIAYLMKVTERYLKNEYPIEEMD